MKLSFFSLFRMKVRVCLSPNALSGVLRLIPSSWDVILKLKLATDCLSSELHVLYGTGQRSQTPWWGSAFQPRVEGKPANRKKYAPLCCLCVKAGEPPILSDQFVDQGSTSLCHWSTDNNLNLAFLSVDWARVGPWYKTIQNTEQNTEPIKTFWFKLTENKQGRLNDKKMLSSSLEESLIFNLLNKFIHF